MDEVEVRRKASGDKAEAAAGQVRGGAELEWRWGRGEKQLDWGVFLRLTLQDCSRVGYRRIKIGLGLSWGEGAFPGLERTGDSHMIREGT